MSAIPNNPNPSPNSSYPRLASDPPLLHPSKLFQLLGQGMTDHLELQAQLQCSAQELRESLASQEAHELLELKTSLCAAHVRLLALKAAPAAVHQLQELLKSEKPMVACRASTAILSLSGLPTASAKSEPAKPLIKPAKTSPLEALKRVIAVLPLNPRQKATLENYNLVENEQLLGNILTPEQHNLYLSARHGKRIPTPPPVKSAIPNSKSVDPSPPQPPRAA